MVAEDRFAQGYMAGLKRQKRLKPYLNMVYLNGQPVVQKMEMPVRQVNMEPGHIRPPRKNFNNIHEGSNDGATSQGTDNESLRGLSQPPRRKMLNVRENSRTRQRKGVSLNRADPLKP